MAAGRQFTGGCLIDLLRLAIPVAGRGFKIECAADIDRIARGETSEGIAAMHGWRYEMFGRKAQALLSGKLAVSFENGQVRLFDV